MSLTCITGGKLCTGCMDCYDDLHYGRCYNDEDIYSDYEEETLNE